MTCSIKVAKSISRNGNSALNKVLSSDSVMDGAFFPQPDFQVPEEKMSQHARYYVMMPAGVLSHLILVHSQLGFGLFKALLDGPSQSAEPDKSWQPCTDRCIADEIVTMRNIRR